MNFKEGKGSTEWVKRLPEVVLALNSEVNVKDESADAKRSTTYSRPVSLKERCSTFQKRWSEASHRSNLVSKGLQYG